MKRLKRFISSLLLVCLLLTLLPMSVLAAHDSTGRPTDLTGQVYLSVYNGTDFPGEPAEYAVLQWMYVHNTVKLLTWHSTKWVPTM